MFTRIAVWGSVLLGVMIIVFGIGYWAGDNDVLNNHLRPSPDPWIRNVRTGEEFWGTFRLQGVYRVTDSPARTWETIITPRGNNGALCRYRLSGNEQRTVILRGVRFSLQVVQDDVICINRTVDQYVAY